MDSSIAKLYISSCSVLSIPLIVIVLLLHVLHKTVGCLSLYDKTAFCVPTGEEKYMERNLNCELINAEHSDYKMCAGHKRSRTPNN